MKKHSFWKSFGALSLFSMLALSNIRFTNHFQSANASGTRTIYLSPNIWDVTSVTEHYYAWLYGSSSLSDSWATLSEDTELNKYVVEIDDSYKNIVFTRSGDSTPSWNVWNQTEDLTLPTDGKNLFTVTSWDGGEGKSVGAWSSYSVPTTSYSVALFVDDAFVKYVTVPAGEMPNDYNPGYGRTFDGWYDSNHNKVTAINSNTNIYGYTEDKVTSYFAIDISEVNTEFTGTLYLYTWDENEEQAPWPGTEIINMNKTVVPYDAKVIINNGTVQTANVESVQDGMILKILDSLDDDENYEFEWVNPGIDPEPTDDHGQDIIYDSKYATYYQLLVYSFADGAGNDGIGDFKGIKDHLDYLVNLGIGGIYLSPVQKADSYHGYDITNYYSVNSDYEKGGYTLKNLVDDCHAVGIKVILDMVLNHSSWNCSWRTQHPSWYSGSDAFSGMIDFDFDNASLREEIKNVGKYWLNEYDVDGYRLDAMRWIYNTGSNEPTEEQHEKSMLWWYEFYQSCKAEKEDVYMIGEDYVYDQNEIYHYQLSGFDSLFDFEMINEIDGAATLSRPAKYISYIENHQMHITGRCDYALGASFLSNHDRGRYGTNLGPNQYTLAGLLNIFAPGDSYIYYGDELNLQVTKSGGYDDFAHRTPMPFASETTDMNSYLKGFGGGVKSVTSLPYGGGTADQKASDESSIYHAYAKAISLKNHNPILYSGTVTVNGNNQDETIGSYFISENDETLTVVYNTSSVNKNITFNDNITLIGDVSFNGDASVNGNQLIMAPYSVAILQGRQSLPKTPKTGLFVKGTMNGWQTNDDYELGICWQPEMLGKILNVTIEAGVEFKIANDDWSESYGFDNIFTNSTFSKPDELILGTENNNIRCTATTTFNIYILNKEYGSGDRRLIFTDVSKVTNPDGGYLFGDWNDWSTDGKIAVNEVVPGEIYKVERVALSAEQEFKLVLIETTYEMWVGVDTVSYTEGYEVSSYGDDKNCKVTRSGIYDITITSDDGLTWNYDVSINTTDSTQIAALEFVNTFNSEIGGICDENGHTNVTNLNTIWSSLAEEFGNLSNEVKNLLKTDLSSSTAKDFIEFNSKYNYVYSKYASQLTAGNFVSRNVANANGNLYVIDDNDTIATFIVIASCVSVLSFAALLMIKKRKHR